MFVWTLCHLIWELEYLIAVLTVLDLTEDHFFFKTYNIIFRLSDRGNESESKSFEIEAEKK